MGMEHFEWEVGDVTVLHLSGSITLGEGTRKFRKLIWDTLDAGKKNILLNMSEVVYLDSSGLGELVAALTTYKNTGGKLKLMKLKQRVQDLVQLIKVNVIFVDFNNRVNEVRSFAD